MLIEEILPINYYNQMIGVIVDTEILKLIMDKLLNKLYKIIKNNKEYEGNFIGDLFINKIFANLFTNKAIDKNISLLIMDYLFLKGNKILFQGMLSIYSFLSNLIIKGEKSIENFNYIINEELKKLTIENEDFIYNLFFVYEKPITNLNIDEYRNLLFLKLARTLEEKNFHYIKSKLKLYHNEELYQKHIDNLKKCKKDWPYCLADNCFENVSRIVEFVSLKKKDNNYIEDYFFEKKEQNEEKKETKDRNKINYNLLLERRPHFCEQLQDQISITKKDTEEPNQINKINTFNDINKNGDNENKNENQIDNLDLIREAINNQNLGNISQMIEENINTDGDQ